MKKIFSLVICFLMAAGFAAAQGKLMLKSGDKGLYLEHKVAAKEGIYSIGRLYNVNPKDLAAYNGLDITKGLNIGQMLRVPLTETNFSQSNASETPVFYKVGEKEGLYRVSINSGKLPIETIKKWNKLTNDNVSAGSQLIVGYLTGAGTAPPVAVTETKPDAEAVKTPDDTPPVVKEEPKPERQPVVIKDEPKEIKEVKADPPVKPVVVSEPVRTVPAGNGYFKDQFAQQIKQQPQSKDLTVTAGIFKTSSGWQDAKYYLLLDGPAPGTIVKIINPSNNKSVFAKVLGGMEGISQNKGLDMRMSNAAAAALEITEADKFVVKLNY